MHRGIRKLPFFLLLLCLWLLGGTAAAGPGAYGQNGSHATVLTSDADITPVQYGISYFFETGRITHLQAAALPDGQWTPWPDGKAINFNTQDRAVWLRFEVRNMTGDNRVWLLEFFWPFLNSVEVYPYDPLHRQWAAPMASGLDVPLDQRPLPHRLYTFPLKLPRDRSAQLYVRCYANSKLFIPINFYPIDFYEKVDDFLNLAFGFYFGILIVMICYNLSLSLFIEDRNYLFYSIYVFCLLLYSLMSTGYGPFCFWDHAVWLKTNGYVVLSALCFLAATLFVRRFLSLKEYGGWVHHCNNGLILYWTLSTILYILKPDPAWVKLEDLTTMISSGIGATTGIYLWRRGNVSARYFTIAWSFPIAGTILLMLGLTGYIELSGGILYGQMIGLVLEVLLLSFALGERINREKASREAAQQAALALSRRISREREDKLEAQNLLLELQQRTNEDLEIQVKERTARLEHAKRRLERTHADLSEVSITDGLTQLHNRHYFRKFLDAELQRAVRLGHPLALLVVDIDHFKRINDTHGHLVGDSCLRQVARTLRQNVIRASDLVVRYGGEEFMLVLPTVTPNDAVVVAERIRVTISELNFIHEGNPIPLRVSIGVAGWVPLKEVDAEQLIQVADDALYEAKQNGRNRIEAAVMAGEVIERTSDKRMGGAHP